MVLLVIPDNKIVSKQNKNPIPIPIIFVNPRIGTGNDIK